MRLPIAVAAVFLALTGAASAKEWKEIRIATEGAYPPFNFFDSNNTLQGFEVDLAKALCEKMKAKCTIVAQDWDGMIPALLAGKYDAIMASMSITEERKQKVDFSDKYYQTPPSVAVPKDSPIDNVDPATFKGKTIGAQSSTIHANYAEEVFADAGASVKLYPTQDEANADLASGRLDAIIADKTVLSEWLKTDNGACCKLAGDVDREANVRFFGNGVGAAVRKEDTDLKEMFNKAIAEVLADGTYQKIREKYFDFDIY
ncbi:ABC transporter substrate-binding protein [Chelatococcus composti]|jgi:polar amino acid transport system substrate-binding protein|uniref:Polar amino acid transport system substrate-binding protein n=1 Tax=Chelatococcus composti TaxID=1743235 RepID=A0A841KGC7_9HYPH|nr:ABC transporter substrate-binding protein [Chelatococcus composti]MBB6168299.1 polar amino acid transport system substrate-binding protein [Chelatococcus composti]MBS7736617.1 ABC transporter substrate-binding protein [Chelatococcus composti]PZN39954.1 MAG: amino acid ABC transporter [Pseudomonadota bacterium]GGG38975.1 amino acid ABC transporter [Chelatococcus composti]